MTKTLKPGGRYRVTVALPLFVPVSMVLEQLRGRVESLALKDLGGGSHQFEATWIGAPYRLSSPYVTRVDVVAEPPKPRKKARRHA